MMNKEILDSWKAISDYLDRDIRTCARWEKELGLPVYRINNHSPRSKVFAYKSEIDEWMKEKSNHNGIRKKPFIERRWALTGLVTAVVLLLTVSVSLYIANGKFSSNTENLSIAVLPFENINFSEHEQFLAEGIQKEIINNLSMLDNIKVIPSALLSKEEESQKNLKDISEKFNVNHALITKLEKNENKLKIRVQLTTINDDNIIWDEESEEILENMFFLQKDICLKIHKKLNPRNKKIAALAFNNRLTQDYEAYNNYLKGNHILSKASTENNDPWSLYLQGKYFQGKWTEESNVIAINLFSKAINIDENFSRAYIGLARCYANYVNFNWDINEKRLNKAEEYLEKAATINTEDPEYYSVLIQVCLLKYFCFDKNTKKEAYELAQKAIENYPGFSQLFAQAGHCFYFNFGEFGNDFDFTKAFELYEKNYFNNPYHINNINFAEILILNEEYNRALAVCHGIQGDESSLMANFRMGETYYYMGDLDKSKAVFLQFDSVNDLDYQIGALFHLGMIAAQRRDIDEVEKILQIIDALILKEYEYFEDKLKLASIYMGIGERELGYKCLEDFFVEEKTKKTKYIYHKYINIDNNFNNFRGEERFKNIIQ
jgi:TolB-like protein